MCRKLHHGISPTDFITRIQRYIITANICWETSIGNHASCINKCVLSQSWQLSDKWVFILLPHIKINCKFYPLHRDWDSVASIATRHGLDGSGLEPRQGQDILCSPYQFRTAQGLTQPAVQWIRVFIPGVKQPGRGVHHLPNSSAKAKNEWLFIILIPSIHNICKD